jgi:1-aminocyclopropane-1-carboxylate deaminase
MNLHFVDRSTFRNINESFDFQTLGIDASNAYFLPEGGTNSLALKGSAELVAETITQLDFCPDFWCVAAGTGGTASGLIQGLDNQAEILVFSALKGDFLKNDIDSLLGNQYVNWNLQSDYHFGGYAKFTPELRAFIKDFNQKNDILLDPIYTGKLFYGIFDLIEKDFFPKGATILAVHTGGLQGIAGFQLLHGE